MPLTKTKAGWMWGSKGPFPSKAKALSVARAAYASGYREAPSQPHPLTANAPTSDAKPSAVSSTATASLTGGGKA